MNKLFFIIYLLKIKFVVLFIEKKFYLYKYISCYSKYYFHYKLFCYYINNCQINQKLFYNFKKNHNYNK